MASPLFALCLAVIGASVPAPSLELSSRRPAAELFSRRPAAEFAAVAQTDGGDFEAALAAVEEANIAVNNDPEANLPGLAAAIEQLSSFGPQIAADPKARETLDLSLLNLARARLVSGDEAGAAAVMDQVLRSAYDRKLPIARFGPTLVDFHDQRRALLDERGTAAIQVQCHIACRVVIDARPANTDSGPLYLGPHRVWIEAVDGSVPSVDYPIELTEAGATEVLHFGVIEPKCEPPPPPPPPAPPEPRRMLPRWAEISVAAIGVGAIIAGGVALGLDGKCPGGLDPVADAERCPELYEGTVPGLVAIGIGSALLVAGGVTLSIDEVRVGKQRGRQAMVGWSLQF